MEDRGVDTNWLTFKLKFNRIRNFISLDSIPPI